MPVVRAGQMIGAVEVYVYSPPMRRSAVVWTPEALDAFLRDPQAVVRGDISAGHLGQTVVYVIILASAFAVLGEVYGDLLRAAGATERLMELMDAKSSVADPAAPQPLPAPAGGSRVEFADVLFHYPSRPQTAALDGHAVPIRLPQDPGQAGKAEAQRLLRLLMGYPVQILPVSGPKTTRAAGMAAQVNGGNVWIVEGCPNADALLEAQAAVINRAMQQLILQ